MLLQDTAADSQKRDVLDCVDDFLRHRAHGPRVDTAQMPRVGKLFAEYARRAELVVALHTQGISAPRGRATHVFFSENEKYGAVAFRARHNFIVLHVGIVPPTVDFCERLVVDEVLWPDAGDRRALAVVFANECFDFVVRHELAHLVLGHCEFMAETGGGMSVEDTDGSLRSGVDPITCQALEVAADGHAAIWGMQNLARAQHTLAKALPNGVDAAFRSFHRAPEEALGNYLLTMFTVFRLFDETAWSTERLVGRRHPPAPIRFHAACLHLLDHLQNNGDADGEARLLRQTRGIWERGEDIFARALGRAPDHSIKPRALSEESEQHFARLRARKQELPQGLFGVSSRDLLTLD